jgi:S-DNA-T family DNA segregation ATPase FtsK/SpoIIIE
MALAVLLSLAIVTYHPVDNPVAQRFSVGQALSPTETPAQNWLGLVGALLARFLVPQFLGYTVLLFTGLLAAWGYVIFRNRPVVNLPFISILTVMGAFLVACLVGWFGQTLDADLSRWGGTMGMGIAGWMQRIFGTVGSFILLVVGGLITLLLAIDHDIQRSIDRVSEALRAFRAGLSRWGHSIQDRWAERREERARRRAERREARAQRRQQKSELSQTAKASSPNSPPHTGSSESATASTREEKASAPPPSSGDTSDIAPTLADDGE